VRYHLRQIGAKSAPNSRTGSAATKALGIDPSTLRYHLTEIRSPRDRISVTGSAATKRKMPVTAA
jgi:hypothetical protein